MSFARPLVLLAALACLAYCAQAMVPLPQQFTYGQKTITLSHAASFTTSSRSALLNRAISRIQRDIFIFPSTAWATDYKIVIQTQSDDENLQLGVGTPPP